jgi:hypothetical protein
MGKINVLAMRDGRDAMVWRNQKREAIDDWLGRKDTSVVSCYIIVIASPVSEYLTTLHVLRFHLWR